MSIDLTAVGNEIVNRQIALGGFASPGEVVETALVMLHERQRSEETLRAELLPAIESLERGEYTVFDAEDIKRRGRERLNAK